MSPTLLSWQHNDYTWHFSHYIWHNSHCISVITPTVLMTSQQVCSSSHLAYVWHHTHFSWNHIDNLWYQYSVFMTSPHPLYWWYHTKCIYEISSAIYDNNISIVYNNRFTRFLTSQPLYLCLTPTLSMISYPLYVLHYTHYMLNII